MTSTLETDFLFSGSLTILGGGNAILLDKWDLSNSNVFFFLFFFLLCDKRLIFLLPQWTNSIINATGVISYTPSSAAHVPSIVFSGVDFDQLLWTNCEVGDYGISSGMAGDAGGLSNFFLPRINVNVITPHFYFSLGILFSDGFEVKDTTVSSVIFEAQRTASRNYPGIAFDEGEFLRRFVNCYQWFLNLCLHNGFLFLVVFVTGA